MILTLSLFAMVTVSFAQTEPAAELPSIDEAEAEAYLGTWYVDQMCEGEACFKASDFGMNGELTVNTDNTMTLTFNKSEEGSSALKWYLEDGIAHTIAVNKADGTEERAEMHIDENGSLVFTKGGENYMTLNREAVVILGTGPVKADAVLEDFAGEWHLNGVLAEGAVFPTAMFGMTGTLVIKENTLDTVMFGEPCDTDLPFELADGKIHAVSVSEGANGEKTESPFTLEYHEEGAVVMITDEGTENESRMVYVREENLNNVDLSALTSGTEGGAAANSEESGMDLSGLISGLLSGSENGEGGLDLSALLQSVTGGENGEGGLDLSGLLQSVTGGNETGK